MRALGSAFAILVYFFSEALIAEASENRVSASQLQVEISEVERDITLRKLLWESSDEWVKLEEEWKVGL